MEQPDRTQAQDQADPKHQHLPAHDTTKDDPSVTPTLSTLDTRSSQQTNNIDPDTILSITMWNQPIVQYQIPFRPSISPRKRSRLRSTAV